MSSKIISRNEKIENEAELKQIDSKSSINVYKMKTENYLISENNIIEINFKKVLEYLEKMRQENIFDDEFINKFENELKNRTLINKIKEEFKGKEKYKKIIQDKINILKIYIDLKNIYDKYKDIMLTPISKNFEDLIKNKNAFEKNEDIKLFINDFDLLYKRIKINIVLLSNNFFQKIEPKKLKFFNRVYMLRIFIAILNKEKKFNKFSIINNNNSISRELISNVIKKMTENNNNDIENYEKIKEYFDIILDYIYFENNFIYSIPQNEEFNKDKSIFDKYISYYGRLSIFLNNNYSYIYEYEGEINDSKYSEIYKEWNKYIKSEYKNEGLKILYNLSDRMNLKKEDGIINNRIYEIKLKFYESIFKLLDEIIKSKKKTKKNIKIINGIIKLIIFDEKNTLKKYMKYEIENKKEIIKQIIYNIKNIIINEIEKGFNYKDINLEYDYLNSLILLFSSFGEYKNKYLLEYIFQKVDEKSDFDKLIDLYEKVLFDLKIKNKVDEHDEDNHLEIKENSVEDFDDVKKNKLIILNSLNICIMRYIELSNIDYGKVDDIKKEDKNDDKKINYKNYKKYENEIFKIIFEKLEKMKINKNNDKKNKKNMIYNIFILENILQIIIHIFKNLQVNSQDAYTRIKYLMEKLHLDNSMKNNKILFYEILYIMNKCFKNYLIQQNISLECDKSSDDNYIKYDIELDDKNINEKEKFDSFDENKISIIKSDVMKLLNKYKNLDIDITKNESQYNNDEKNVKKELFILICLNYQILFYLINCNFTNLHQFEYILNINDNYNNIKKAHLLIDMIFLHRKKRLIILLSFLQLIHDCLEIKIDNNNLFIINLIKPEYLFISKNTKNYFRGLIDYSSLDTKLMTIYNYIECIIYDINSNRYENDENCFNKFLFCFKIQWKFISDSSFGNYKFLETINLLAFIVLNIIMIIYYKKPRSGNYEQFNEIDNNQDFSLTKKWPIIHGIILFLIIIYWIFSRCKIDYFYSMIKYSNK